MSISTREFVCIGCPLGCNITVEHDEGQIKSITGNTCPRGAEYVTGELTDPRRIVTSLVKVEGGELPVVSVKTRTAIPKDKIFDCTRALRDVVVSAPVHMGDVVAADICSTGIDVIATKTVERG